MNLAPIGYFSKTHGLKGHLVLKADRDFFTDRLQALFIEVAGAKAPYFISDLKQSGGNTIIALEELDTVEKAKKLIGKTVFIDENLVHTEGEEEDWTGYELVDKHYGVLGEITSVTDNGQQVLISVNHKGQEVILPLVDEFIERVDEEAKKLFFNAPEGLINLYLSESEEN
jgi:16S rRNA processing protein RimM